MLSLLFMCGDSLFYICIKNKFTIHVYYRLKYVLLLCLQIKKIGKVCLNLPSVFSMLCFYSIYILFSGFKLDNNTKQALVFKYSNEKSLVDFDSCLSCLSKLTQLFSKWIYSLVDFDNYLSCLSKLTQLFSK